jgi:sugar lactone lactonase YvrE
MNISTYRFALGCSLAAIFAASMSGCGGGGASGGPTGLTGGGSGGGGSKPIVPNATALFHVDVKTGKVTVQPLKGGGTQGKAFRGSAVTFGYGTLLDQAGDVGRKVLSVSLTNTSGEPIGYMSTGTYTGINVLFSNFTNVAAFSDVRSKTAVSNFAGTGTAGTANGASGLASFNHPESVTIARDGSIYVADTSNNKIRKIFHGLVSTLAGSGAAITKDGVGAQASFNGPAGICVDYYGVLYVTESGGNCVRRVQPDGVVSTVAGTGVAGSNDAYGDTATFNKPSGICIGGSSYLYVADSNKIRQISTGYSVYDPSSYQVTTLAGTGVAGNVDGAGNAAQFNSPRGLAYDGDNKYVYVADFNNNSIRRVSTDSAHVVTIAGTGTAGGVDGLGNVATFANPTGVALANQALFVSDFTGNRIRQVTLMEGGSSSSPASYRVVTLAGTGAAGSANGLGNAATFNQPYMIAADGANNIFVPDFGGHLIRRVRPANGVFPIGIATGTAPAEQVQLFNPDGIIPSSGYGVNLPYINYTSSLSNGSSTSLKDWVFIIPKGVTAFEFTVTVEAGTDYGAPPEVGTNQGSANVDVRTVAGNKIGYVDGILTEARFNNITGIALDSRGNMYVADTANNSIRRIGYNGIVTTIGGGIGNGPGNIDGTGLQARFNTPTGVAVSSDDDAVYVADSGNHEIRRLWSGGSDAASWSVTTIAGTGTAGKADGTGAVATLNSPYGIAYGSGGLLYITEKLGNRVRRMQFKGGDASVGVNWQVSTVAGDTVAVAGAAGVTDATGAAARFSKPLGIALDRTGTAYVADSGNNRIRKVSTDGVVTTFAGSTVGYADGLGTAAQFNAPAGIAMDTANYAYVADSGSNHIRRVAPSGDVKTVAGTGVAGTANGPGNVATFANPTAIAADVSATLYVADFNLGTIRMVQRVLTGENTKRR